jgi:hypothetical protein
MHLNCVYFIFYVTRWMFFVIVIVIYLSDLWYQVWFIMPLFLPSQIFQFYSERLNMEHCSKCEWWFHEKLIVIFFQCQISLLFIMVQMHLILHKYELTSDLAFSFGGPHPYGRARVFWHIDISWIEHSDLVLSLH